ncbi:MAG: SIMPL domain-containing protein [Verrucomicrobiota bacterium]|nr:SIMPL domain-containing protein [Verrucomicrobiota bacterium]
MADSSLSRSRHAAVLGISFIVGMTVFGLLLGHAVRSFKRLNEFVTVKGLSEREVPADLAAWPIAFTVGENDLGRLQAQIESSRKTVRDFLVAGGFDEGEVSNAPPQISDSESMAEEGDIGRKRAFRYIAKVTVLLRTTQIAKAKAALEASDKLVQQGIVLSGGEYMSKPQFLFTGLNQIKPNMIQEANRAARQSAEKFAADSNAEIGAIRHAVQGPFEINDVDASSPDRKIVRVVTTVDFYLK